MALPTIFQSYQAASQTERKEEWDRKKKPQPLNMLQVRQVPSYQKPIMPTL